MNIALTPEQQNLIQAKLKTGKYQSSQQIIEIALRLFDEYEQAESEWSQQVRTKIQAAIDASENTAPVDGETFEKKTEEKETEDFLAIAGIWEDRTITAETLRKEAWKEENK